MSEFHFNTFNFGLKLDDFIKKVKALVEHDLWDYHVMRVKKNGTIEADNDFVLKPDDLYVLFDVPAGVDYYYVLMKKTDDGGRVLAVVKDTALDMDIEEGVPVVIADRNPDKVLKEVERVYWNAGSDSPAYELLYKYLSALWGD